MSSENNTNETVAAITAVCVAGVGVFAISKKIRKTVNDRKAVKAFKQEVLEQNETLDALEQDLYAAVITMLFDSKIKIQD